MSAVRPELIFVAGPQSGQRIVLKSNLVLIGRTPDADVELLEPQASRRQLQLELTGDGWLMENLGSAGTGVNGKRFKSQAKRVALATGDVLSMGLDTQILFVDAGDDADQALNDYRQKHPFEEAKSPPEAPPAIRPSPDGEPTNARKEAFSKDGRPGQAARQLRQSKIRKYAVAAAVYAVFIVAVVVVLSMLKGQDKPVTQQASVLSDEQIKGILSAVPTKSFIPTRAASELREAQVLHDNLPAKTGDEYRCVKGFQLYLAYRGRPEFDRVEDERNYQTVLRDLTDVVLKKYRNAWAYQQAGNWARADETYRELLQVVPEGDPGNRVYDELVQNIREHVTYVKGHLPKKRR